MDVTTSNVEGVVGDVGEQIPSGAEAATNDSGFGSEQQQPLPDQGTGSTDSNLTHENVAAMRAAATQKYMEISRKEQELRQREEQIQQMAVQTQKQQQEYQAAQVALRHPAVRQAMMASVQQNAASLADIYIQQGLAQPHERQQLISELAGQQIYNQQQPQQFQQPMYPQMQPQQQLDPSAISRQVFEQVQQQMKQQEADRQIETTVSEFKQRYLQDYGREASQQDVDSFLRFAYTMGQNPLSHAYKAMNHERIVAQAHAKAREQAMRDMRAGPDPYGGGTLSEDDPRTQQIANAILNA